MREGTLSELNLKDGDVVEFVRVSDKLDPWVYPTTEERTVTDGRVFGIPVDDYDAKGIWRIVSRANPSPVREVTRKEIVPGEYGSVEVTSAYDGLVSIDVQYNHYNATQLRQVINTLTEIADALEDAK